ncbi:MAG: hypothetical protein QTN59_17800 [Candidatus Electrothrix communis]|nr:MAG: hypothetical protein QTN59_17800 [Candidatus Electrothrix communis]
MDWLIALLLPLSSYPQAAYLKNLLIDRYGFFEVVGGGKGDGDMECLAGKYMNWSSMKGKYGRSGHALRTHPVVKNVL